MQKHDEIKIKNRKKIFFVLFVNVIALVISLILFEPTLKQDDQDMTYLLYGAYDGNYSAYILYINYIYASVLKKLLIIMPNIPWYSVIFYLFIFASFCVISIYCVSENWTITEKTIYTVVILLLSHEFYIRLTFTKVSGLVIITGLVLLNAYLEDKKIIKILICVICFVLGNLIRSRVFMMCAFIYFFAYLTYMIRYINGKEYKKMLAQTFSVAMVFIVAFGINTVLGKYSQEKYFESEEWKTYFADNASRASLMDYGGAPNYYMYEDRYKELGISYNDTLTWWSYGWRIDTDRLTNSLTREVRNISLPNSKKTFLGIIKNGISNFWKYHRVNVSFYLFIFTGIVSLLVINNKLVVFDFVLMGVGGVGSYLYLYYKGRITHHVEIVIWTACLALFLFGIKKYKTNNCRLGRIIPIMVIILGLYISEDYSNIVSNAYMGAAILNNESEYSMTKRNRNNLQILSSDKEHCYIFPVNEWFSSYLSTNAFEVVESNLYHNLFNVFSSINPVGQNIYKQYGITNPMRELCDSDILYIACSSFTEGQIPYVEKYLDENYCDVTATNVKEVDNIKIYKFMSNDYEPTINNIKDARDVQNNLDIHINNNTVSIDGDIFIENVSSYVTNIYLVIETEEGNNYIQLKQTESKDAEDDLHGLYGHIYNNINISKYDQIQSVSILLENNGDGYIIPINEWRRLNESSNISRW